MPSIPQLQWNLIGPLDFYSGSINPEGYVRTIDRLVGYSQFWRTIALDVTSSLSAAIVIAPNVGLDLAPMRVLICGGTFPLTGNMLQDRSAGVPDTFTANNMYVGLTPSASNGYVAGGWNQPEPFGTTGSLNRWSKYWSIGQYSRGSAMFMVESQESFMLHVMDPGTVAAYGCLVGAILTSYDQGSGESGRVYGMATTGDAIPASNFWAVSTDWLGHNTTANSKHMGQFEVLDGVGLNSWTLVSRGGATTFSAQWPGETSTSQGTITGLAQHIVRVTGGSATGFLRQIYAHQDRYMVTPGLLTSGSTNRRDSRVVGAYVTYGSHTGVGDCMLMVSTGSQGSV